MAGSAFNASDLARRRRELLDASRTQRSVIRDADGTLFTLGLAADVAASDALAALGATLAALVSSLDKESPNASSLGPLAFVANWAVERRGVLANDLAEALSLANSLHDPTPAQLVIDTAKPEPPNPNFDVEYVFANLAPETRERIESRRQLHPRRTWTAPAHASVKRRRSTSAG